MTNSGLQVRAKLFGKVAEAPNFWSFFLGDGTGPRRPAVHDPSLQDSKADWVVWERLGLQFPKHVPAVADAPKTPSTKWVVSKRLGIRYPTPVRASPASPSSPSSSPSSPSSPAASAASALAPGSPEAADGPGSPAVQEVVYGYFDIIGSSLTHHSHPRRPHFGTVSHAVCDSVHCVVGRQMPKDCHQFRWDRVAIT